MKYQNSRQTHFDQEPAGECRTSVNAIFTPIPSRIFHSPLDQTTPLDGPLPHLLCLNRHFAAGDTYIMYVVSGIYLIIPHLKSPQEISVCNSQTEVYKIQRTSQNLLHQNSKLLILNFLFIFQKFTIIYLSYLR